MEGAEREERGGGREGGEERTHLPSLFWCLPYRLVDVCSLLQSLCFMSISPSSNRLRKMGTSQSLQNTVS